jgi:hypothetical protein
MPPGGGGEDIYDLDDDVDLAVRPYDLPIGQVNIFGNSKLRTSSIIIQLTSVCYIIECTKFMWPLILPSCLLLPKT